MLWTSTSYRVIVKKNRRRGEAKQKNNVLRREEVWRDRFFRPPRSRACQTATIIIKHFSYIVVAWKLCFASGDVASVHELQDSRVADGLYCMRICDPLWCRPVSTQPKLSDTRVCLSGGFGHCLYSCIARPGKKAEAISSALRWLLRRTSTSSSHSAAEGVYSINLE